MDPCLEMQGLWPDFHSKFVNCLQELLLDRLPSHYDARLEERLYLVELAERSGKLIRPDVAVIRSQGVPREFTPSPAVATLEPVTVPLCVVEEVREVSIRILHRPNQTLVAVLEMLSPSNKSSSGRGFYLEKRAEIIAQSVHLVELDLLVAGYRLPMGRLLPPGQYYAIVSRAERRPNSEVYAWTIRNPLPTIPIPLRAPDADIAVDLGEVFATAYRRGRYERALDYTAAPWDHFDSDDRRWITTQAAISH